MAHSNLKTNDAVVSTGREIEPSQVDPFLKTTITPPPDRAQDLSQGPVRLDLREWDLRSARQFLDVHAFPMLDLHREAHAAYMSARATANELGETLKEQERKLFPSRSRAELRSSVGHAESRSSEAYLTLSAISQTGVAFCRSVFRGLVYRENCDPNVSAARYPLDSWLHQSSEALAEFAQKHGLKISPLPDPNDRIVVAADPLDPREVAEWRQRHS